jgi:hypothetical protein
MRPDKFPHILEPTHKEYVEAKARAKELGERAHFSEAMAIVKSLEDEVVDMHISNRFSATKKPNLDYKGGGVLVPSITGLTEAEFKRKSLLMELQTLKNKIGTLASDVAAVVMDIEATKIDDVNPESPEK